MPRAAAEHAVAAPLRAAHERARRVHPTVALDLDTYRRGVIARLERRLARSGARADANGLRRALGAASLTDVYLTIACDHGVAGAWERLVEAYAPRLDALARSIGAREEGGSVGRDLIAHLAAPPAAGGHHTRLGTYDGSGSLFAWLAVILRRRRATASRRRTSPPTSVEPAALDERARPPAEDPLAALVDEEEGRRILHALHDAWRELSPRQQLALHFKYGEAVRLKDIGAMLGLSESGASRLVSGAIRRLREAVRPHLDSDRIPAARLELWAALWQAVRPGADTAEDAP